MISFHLKQYNFESHYYMSNDDRFFCNRLAETEKERKMSINTNNQQMGDHIVGFADEWTLDLSCKREKRNAKM